MQKLNHSPADIAPPAVRFVDASIQLDSGFDPSRRLLVIVSDADFDTPAAARRILEVANAFKSRVLFLGLYADEKKESSLRRQLITLSAMIRDENVPFEIKIESGKDWLNHVKFNWREGDVLVCFSGQRAGTRRMPLGALLQSNFPSSVYVLDADTQPERPRSNWIPALLTWAGSIGILLVFFWLQISLDRNPRNLTDIVIQIGSIPLEGWLIWIWNSLLG